MDLTPEELKKAHSFSQLCTYGKKKDVKSTIEKGEKTSNVNGFDFRGKTYGFGEVIYFRPLSSAVFGKNYKVVKLLLKLGADPNIIEINYQGSSKITSSPLYDAILKDDLKVIELLMKFGADCNISNIFMNKACKNGNLEIVKFLLPKTEEENLISCLEEAVTENNCDIIDYFFEMFGKNSKEFNNNIEFFREAFTTACYSKNSDIIRLFIKHIENNNIITKDPDDDFQPGFFEEGFLLAINNHVDFDTLMLIFIKCNPNYINEDCENFISVAINVKRYDVLNFLMEYCDLNKINSENFFTNLFESMKNSEESFDSCEFEKTFRKLLNICAPNEKYPET